MSRRGTLSPLPFLLLASALGVALGAVVTVDLGPLPAVRSSLPLPDAVPLWGEGWSPRVVSPDAERGAALERLSALVGLVGAAAVLAALGAAATVLGTSVSARRQEVALRAALGASPWRLHARLVRGHALLLALGVGGGGLLGLGGAVAARRAWPDGVVALPDPTLPLALLAVAALLTLVLATGPVRAAGPRGLPALLSGARATAGRGEIGARRLLLVLQIAGALAVPIPALLLLTPSPAPDEGGVAPDLAVASVTSLGVPWEALLRRLEADRSLASESIATPGAWDGLGPVDLAVAECRCSRGTMYLHFLGATARHHAVTPGFFDAAGLAVLEGRSLGAADGAGGEPVAVVSRSFARANFDGSPLGRYVRIGRLRDGFHRVVGVVEDRRVAGLADGGGAEIYLSLFQHPAEEAVVAARSPGGAAAAAEGLRDAALGAGMAPGTAGSREAAARARLAPLRWMGAAGVGLAALALLAALAGVHAVSRLEVAARRRDLAVRRALGATGGALARWLLARRVRDLAWGGVLGLWAAISAAALLREVVVLPGPVRAAPFALVLAAVVAVALLGTVRGVRDALSVSPAAALAGDPS